MCHPVSPWPYQNLLPIIVISSRGQLMKTGDVAVITSMLLKQFALCDKNLKEEKQTAIV